jgi:opacity protein-like surface antigen
MITMKKLLLLAIMIAVCAPMAFAQSTEYNKFEFYGGYSHNRVDTGTGTRSLVDDREGFNGFNTAVTGNITRYFGLKFDLAGHYKPETIDLGGSANIKFDSNLYNFLGGVQVKDNAKEGTFKPFAQALVGVARSSNSVEFNNIACIAIFPSPCTNFNETDTGLAGAFGGGLDIRLNNRIDVRAVQIDYNPTRLFGGTQHNFRVGAGVVIH